MRPFGHPFGDQNRSKNRPKIELLKRSLQDRPKSVQDPPKRPPRPPRRASGPPKRPSGLSRMPQEALPTTPGPPPDPSGRPKKLFRSTCPKTFFRKIRKNQPRLFSEGALCTAVVGNIEKFENVEKMSKKKVDDGHPQWSPAPVLTKTKGTFKTVEH